MIAEGMAKRKNSPMQLKISIEIGARDFAQAEEYLIYNTRKVTFNQFEIQIANAPPRFCSPDLNTNAQQRGICKETVTEELMTIGIIRLCV